MKQKVIIIGAGLGGLFTGAILSKEGFEVTLLEKNALIGGGLETFHRFGEHFDTGMHVIGGMHPDGNIWKICRYLGIGRSADILVSSTMSRSGKLMTIVPTTSISQKTTILTRSEKGVMVLSILWHRHFLRNVKTLSDM